MSRSVQRPLSVMPRPLSAMPRPLGAAPLVNSHRRSHGWRFLTCWGLLLGTLLASVAGSLSAREIYVDNQAGNDRFDGTYQQSSTQGGPVRTINRALQLALSGDRIILANTGTPYHEQLSLSTGRHRGSSFAPLVIDGRGATLDGSLPIDLRVWRFDRESELFVFQPPRRAHQQLFRDGVPLVRRRAEPGVPGVPELEPLEWCLHQGEIYFRPEDGHLPEEYNLSYAALQTGITLYHVDHVVIGDLTVQGYQLDGINAFDGVSNCRLVGLTLRGNARAGLTVAGSSKVEVAECLIGDNGTAQVLVEGLGVVRLRESQLLDNTAPPLVIRAGGRAFVDGQAVNLGQ